MCACDGHGMWLQVSLMCAIGACSMLGDLGLGYGRSAGERAAFDNATHATVGGLTWTLILVLSQKPLARNLNGIFCCFLLASLVDVDHFIAARSWRLGDATHLEKRPFLHCTTIPITLWMFLGALSSTFRLPTLEHASWIILAAFLSHHLRDGTRRGLWLYPFGSTRPIPYCVYVSLSMFLPYVLYWLMSLYPLAHKTHANITVINI